MDNSFHTHFMESISEHLAYENLIPLLIYRNSQRFETHTFEEFLESYKTELQEAVIDETVEDFPIRVGLRDEVITITEQDLETYMGNLKCEIVPLMSEIIEDSSSHVLQQWLTQADGVNHDHQILDQSFNEGLLAYWKESLYMVEVLTLICLDLGTEFYAQHLKESERKQDYVFEALGRLHARGCQIAQEVCVLLKNGMADGAHARWRTLHEVMTVAVFIREYGHDTAKRFLDHSLIKKFKLMNNLKEHANNFNFRPPTDKEFTRMERKVKKLKKLYGKNFEKDYGWAAKACGIESPNMSQIEEKVNHKHFRQLYGHASSVIHADSWGLINPLGKDPSGSGLIAGPSMFGLTIPGRNTAYSIGRLTLELLLIHPTIDNLAHCGALTELVKRTGESFEKDGDRIVAG